VEDRAVKPPAKTRSRGAAASGPQVHRADPLGPDDRRHLDVLRLQSTVGNAAAARLVGQGAVPGLRVQRTIGDGHDLQNNRFAGIAALEAAFDGESTIGPGASGGAVRVLQQGLLDAGFVIPPPGVSGTYGPTTRAAVRAFQASKGLSAAQQTGIVGRITMDLLDRHFLGHAPERAIATDTTRTLLEGTRTLTAADKAAFRRAITTEQRTASGALPVFHRTIGTHPDPYEVRIRTALDAAVTGLHTLLVASRPPRTPANLIPGTEIDGIAAKAKDETDKVFGRYKTGPALAFGLNIKDQFDVRDAEIAASPAAADAAAAWRVDKLLDGDDDIKVIDRQHGAVQSRAAEAALIAPVRSAVITARRAELLAIHRNWPASAGGGEINLQRYRGPTAARNRDILYDLFGTVIHEYIHTLESPAHVTFRSGLAAQRGGFVLREGTTDFFAKVVWDGLTFDAPLRAAIEGGFHDPANPTSHPVPLPDRYAEWRNAERSVGVVGIRNLMAAFFLGRTDLIG